MYKLIGDKIFDIKPGHGLGPMVASCVPKSITTDEQAAQWMEHRGGMNHDELMAEREIALQNADDWPPKSPEREAYLQSAQELLERAEMEL